MKKFNLLPSTSTYGTSFLPFFLPYAVYTGSEMLSSTGVPAQIIQGIKLVAVIAVLVYFRKFYRFGRITPKIAAISLIATPVLLCLWIYPLKYFLVLAKGPAYLTTIPDKPVSEMYYYLRFVNSAFIVPVFEELLCRIYLIHFFYDACKRTVETSLIDRITATIDTEPSALQQIPFSRGSLIAATIIFTLGHDPASFISAIVYFSATNWLYWKSGSVWTCILTHSFTNLGIALLVKYKGLTFLWF